MACVALQPSDSIGPAATDGVHVIVLLRQARDVTQVWLAIRAVSVKSVVYNLYMLVCVQIKPLVTVGDSDNIVSALV